MSRREAYSDTFTRHREADLEAAYLEDLELDALERHAPANVRHCPACDVELAAGAGVCAPCRRDQAAL